MEEVELVGRTITLVEARGKNLLIHFDDRGMVNRIDQVFRDAHF